MPDVDATVVSRLREAGAVLLGKLNLTEGAMGGYHPDFDVPLNPWDRTRWPGASSSGSGVATAAGLCFGALGTDALGSIRFPSSANGVVGLKPTYGRVSRFGMLALAESFDHVGPMARRVADVAIVFDAIAGVDPRDPTSLQESGPTTYGDIGQGVQGLRIGLDREYALAGVDSGQAAAIEEALKVLAGLGARIVEVHMPNLAGTIEAAYLLCGSEAVAAHAANYPSRAQEYGPYFREFLQVGASATQTQLAGAKRFRAEFAARLNTVLADVDAIACPSGGAPALPITREIQIGSMTAFRAFLAAASTARNPPLTSVLSFTVPANLAGTSAICLLSGFSPEGLPYSIQFVGRRLKRTRPLPNRTRVRAGHELARPASQRRHCVSDQRCWRITDEF